MQRFLLLALGIYGVFRLIRRLLNENASSLPRPVPQPIPFERSPERILGLDEDADAEAALAAIERIRRENDPQRLEGLSAELKDTARRRLEDAEAAYLSLSNAEE